MGARRRVLVLAYVFPPLGGAGVQRTLKFVRYLEPLGWDATVITTRSRAYGARDPSLLEEIPPGTRVIRTWQLPLLRWAGFAANRLRMRWLYRLLMWPDGGRGWVPFAFLAALREVRRVRPDVIFSTSPPYGAHLLAMWVARRARIPWVADFRDEWASNPHYPQRRGLGRLTGWAERMVTTNASRIIVAADYFHLQGLTNDDRRRTVIVNGVDEADLPDSDAAASSTRFVLAHVGTVYEATDLEQALCALARLIEREEVEREILEVRLVGSIWLDRFKPPPGIALVRRGYVDHVEAVREMRSATALLLYRPIENLAPTGKLFEYLASGRPLLCVAHADNLASRLVRNWDAGVTADPADSDQIEAAILTLWRRWRETGLPDQPEVRRRTLEQFSRQAGAAQLAAVLAEAARG